ncbi:hypothetical protein WBP07_31240 [Novosphingobium sp. BL-8A]|uniref:hypothetical protein n=1 Tax=Novosphingobium sp. BL-8A TaxID=3127639 RepID=UPI0037569CD5
MTDTRQAIGNECRLPAAWKSAHGPECSHSHRLLPAACGRSDTAWALDIRLHPEDDLLYEWRRAD